MAQCHRGQERSMDTIALTTSPGKQKITETPSQVLRIFPWFFSLAHFSLPGQWSLSVIPMCKANSDSATSSLVDPSHLCLCYYSSFLISLPGVTLSPSSHYPIVAWSISGGWGADVPCKTAHSTFPSRTWLRCTFHSALHDLDLPVFPCLSAFSSWRTPRLFVPL